MDREERDMGGNKAGARKLGLLLCVAAIFALSASSAGAAVPPLLGQTPDDGKPGAGAGRFVGANGIAADPNLPGHVYVSDRVRIDEFTAWGEFVKAWGWGVVDGKAELQVCTRETGCREGLEGGGEGQLAAARAIAVDGTGNIQVLDSGNYRVQTFSPAGAFLGAFGGDVVAYGPGDSANDEVQEVIVAATGGTFKLQFKNPWSGGGTKETAALPYNASAAEVEAALNGLATIGGLGGSVKVTGGPGNPTGSNPYLVTFEGNLGGDDLPPLAVDSGSLAEPAVTGYSLECGPERSEAFGSSEDREVASTEVDHYQWLRNGSPIPGATGPTYTVTVADEGKALQCQAFAFGPAAGVTSLSRSVHLVAPVPVEPAPDDPPEYFLTFSEGAVVGTAGGGKTSCSPFRVWEGASSFSFSWYRNGVLIPGATASTYTFSEADLASPAVFQCVVVAANAEGTARVVQSQLSETSPAPQPAAPGGRILAFGVQMSPPTRVATPHEGGGAETCSAAAGDACKAGRRRKGGEQVGEGAQVFAFDQAGSAFIAQGSVINVFEPGGAFRESIAMPPDKSIAGIATDSAGDLYVGFGGEGDVRKLAPSGPTAEFLDPTFAAEGPALRVEALALDGKGNLYVGYATSVASTIGGPRINEFDATGQCLTCGEDGEDGIGGKGGFGREIGTPTAIATSSTCEADGLYAAFQESGAGGGSPKQFFRVFGPPPNPDLCPQPLRAPEVRAQYALSVTAGEAELQARINPSFWNDTKFAVEYGTEPCSQGGCAATATRALTLKTTNATLKSPAVVLEGLEAGTTYHYRFVAQSGGGGPVYGVDPDGEGPEEATPEGGLEGSFTTFRASQPQDCPENEALRVGPAASLPDCRAYEMVSPADKENGDIAVLTEIAGSSPAVIEKGSADGEKLTFGSARSFAGSVSAPLTTQYLAARDADEGWLTHPISPPHDVKGGLETEFRAFSEDLCDAWVLPLGDPLLAPGAQPGVANLYRRSDELCGGPSYETLSTSPGYTANLELEGFSADGLRAIYVAIGQLTEDAPALGPNDPQLYHQEGAQTRFVCILPSGEASQKPCTAGDAFYSPFGNGAPRMVNLAGAISADGQRVFWTAEGDTSQSNGPIYVRENPGEEQSALAHGAAGGTGKLSEGSTAVTSLIAASGKASFTAGSPTVTLLETAVGKFVVGQPVSSGGGKLPAGTTIKSISGSTLTLSAAAGATSASAGIASIGPMPFAVGQAISAPGIPAGTTIAAVKAGELTLSKAATVTKSNVALSAISECTEAAKACTLAVSQAAEEEAGSEGSRYRGAARDGSVAVFLTGGSLYEFDVNTRATHKIAGGVNGVMGMSEDASQVYFTSTVALSGPNGEGEAPVAGKDNLYLYEAGAGGGQFRFIGTLIGVGGGSEISPVAGKPRYRISRVSADGLHAAFATFAPLSGYDNADALSEAPTGEVYLYDASAGGGEGKLICASCNPSGARPRSGTDRWVGAGWASWIPTHMNVLYPSRVLAEDGQRLFFNSFDALVPRDTNGRADVYQWEAPGKGSCEESSPSYSPLNEGCVDLISSGKSLVNSIFVDAGASGNDVFFTTLSSFAPQDNGLLDVYDARVGGGFPVPGAPPAACEGEACQSSPEAPNDPTPASESFEGAGNVKEEAVTRKPVPCAKGKVKRHGKCVAKKHRHRAKRKRRAGR